MLVLTALPYTVAILTRPLLSQRLLCVRCTARAGSAVTLDLRTTALVLPLTTLETNLACVLVDFESAKAEAAYLPEHRPYV